jgi:hypothetical protein
MTASAPNPRAGLVVGAMCPSDGAGLTVAAMWGARQAGLSVRCAFCAELHVALSVADSHSYRWICMRCGRESPWFIVTPNTIRLHAAPGAGHVTIPSADEVRFLDSHAEVDKAK